MRWTVAFLILGSALAGCIGAKDAPKAESSGAEAPASGAGGGAGPAAQRAGLAPRTLDAPPQLAVGEWWNIEATDVFDGATYVATRVVAAIDGDTYLVGMPADDFVNALMVLHLPGFGEVGRADLSFEIHDQLYEPVKFPLAVGKKWATQFEGRAVDAEVMEAGGATARVQFDGANDHFNVTYDAALGEVSLWGNAAYMTYKIVDHGFDYTGLVTVPHEHDLIFVQARIGGALGPGLQPAPPTEEVEVDPTYDRVSFVLLAGTFLPSTDAPHGVYLERVTAPDGTEFELQVLPTDAPGFHAAYYQMDQPGGKWSFVHVAGGPGLVLTEGIAYHVYDIDLATGRLLPSTGQHPHGE